MRKIFYSDIPFYKLSSKPFFKIQNNSIFHIGLFFISDLNYLMVMECHKNNRNKLKERLVIINNYDNALSKKSIEYYVWHY